MALPDRRRVSVVQKISLSIEIGMAVTLATLIFQFGRSSEKWDGVAEAQKAQGVQLEALNNRTSQVSGQVLQMATTSNMAAAEARIQVVETKQATNEQLLRELKADMTDRLRRIEAKIDQRR